MPIRSFVTVSALLLMGWLALAFVHRPVFHGGVDPITAEADQEAPISPEEVDDLAVSVSP